MINWYPQGIIPLGKRDCRKSLLARFAGRDFGCRKLVKSKLGEVSEWLMVPLSKSGVAFSNRGFESHPLRHLRLVSREYTEY